MKVDLTLDARPTLCTRRPTWADNDRMRTTLRLLALAGGLALAAAVVLDIGWGNPGHSAWVLLGPLPFYAVGVVAFAYRPDNPVIQWLLAWGALFPMTTLLNETLPPLVSSPGIVLVAQWLGGAGIVVLVGLVGLFPVGRPDHWVDRVVLAAISAAAIALPVLGALANPAMLLEPIPEPGTPTTPSPIFVERLAPLGPVTARLYDLFPLCVFAGVGLLALRYRRETAPRRRQIRVLLVGWSVGPVLALISTLLLLQVEPDALVAWIAYLVLWPVTLTLVLGSLLVALLYDGAFGIDRPARRRHVHSLLRGLILLAVVGIAGGLGVLAAAVTDSGSGVLIGVVAAVALQPVRGRLERFADRWVFGARLDGYGLLARFSAVLERAPDRVYTLDELVDTVRHGLDLTWARVHLDDDVASAGHESTGAALVVAIRDGDAVVGRIECGPRRDGNPLLAEDRRLLVSLAGQAAAAARSLQLAEELSERLRQIERQAAELAASRDRVVAAQDAERRRIQRDLHDGVQQEVVALTAKLGLACQRLGRGDRSGERLLVDLQADLGDLLSTLRAVAHAIHPPVLADRGLLSAVEAQAARLPVAMAVHADPALREVRFPPRIEATAWYALAEALSNVVKHANATQVEVFLQQPDGRLTLEVRDDGRGFDAEAPRGLGLTGLADRLDIVGGSLVVESAAGRGTALRMDIPVRSANG
jgi:signal transduction histidine kinase